MEAANSAERAKAERHRRNVMASRLFVLKLRKHHYEYAPESLKSKWVPSTIVGDPIINNLMEMIDDIPPPNDPSSRRARSSVEIILALVARYYKVAVDEITGSRRSAKTSRVRQIAMFLAHEHTTESVSKLARSFCRDHSTLLHGHNTIARLQRTDKLLALQICTLRKQLENCREIPDAAAVKAARIHRRMTNQRWDIESEVKLIQAVRAGASWAEIGKELGVSYAAACNKYLRLEAARTAYAVADHD